MTEPSVAWIPAIVVLVAGAIAGALLVWRARGGRSPVAPPVEIRDLRAQLDALVAQLRELDDLAATRTPAQLEQERRTLEIAAAETLRDLERAEAAQASMAVPPSPEPSPAPAGGSTLRGFLWGVGSVLAIVLLAVFVSESASDREPEAAPAAAIDPMNIEALRQRVEADPTNVEARLDLAQSLVIAGEVAGAESQIEAVLARAPDHPRALSYAALVRFARGDLPGAVAAAERSIELDPSNPEPRVHLAIILAQIGETGRAAAVLDEAIRLFPGDASALERLRAEILGPGAAAASGNVTVEIDAPPDAASRRGTLFVVLRPAADAPPIAIRREPISTFPVRVEITPADLMEGDAFPASMVVEARLDADGLFATTAAGDLSGSVGDVTPGSVARIVLHP